MIISFVCSVSTIENEPYLNAATFLLNGEEVTIDRDHTEYVFYPDAQRLLMQWRGCYIWDGWTENYNIPEEFVERAKFKEFEYDEEAPEAYEVRCVACWTEVRTESDGCVTYAQHSFI